MHVPAILYQYEDNPFIMLYDVKRAVGSQVEPELDILAVYSM